MNMVWHDYVALNGQVIVKVVQLIDILIRNLSVFCQFDLRTVWGRGHERTVGDAGPYNARENTSSFFRAYRQKYGLI